MSKAIFVIDDNVLTRTLVSDALRASGYEPVPYPSATLAMEALRTTVPLACDTTFARISAKAAMEHPE